MCILVLAAARERVQVLTQLSESVVCLDVSDGLTSKVALSLQVQTQGRCMPNMTLHANTHELLVTTQCQSALKNLLQMPSCG